MDPAGQKWPTQHLPQVPSVNPGSNLTGIPSGLLISAEFHAFPVPLHIAGVRDGHPALFLKLSSVREQCEAGQVFQAYMEKLLLAGMSGRMADASGRAIYACSKAGDMTVIHRKVQS